ncbi:tRNA-uridine aminocarboxypropyltransferase [Paucibacter sp. Y2R2-4]|uniref:tRNA-uridine aminocarboxypropyltransferase n=1 Tax=Paucibacter sp. Y2R2-4 TaxID=2893553 RepID=UPI0021E3DE1C|nr:tRNA-uridine aminocarboxypropyltransferase [Paucibacter sp. Y2R2-4]MCV2351631.1 DTW domain-containing protein [Paucibacter sp. Y2R2-4]
MTRAQCLKCQRPLRACICAWVRPVDNRVELLVLQHPLEQHHSKGTVRLLQLSLHRCQVWVGEQFEPEHLARLLAVPEVGGGTCLLYPPDAQADDAPALFAPAEAGGLLCTRLVLLDATWRKSRKMLHLNPLLRQLPRLSLSPTAPSRYAIRKAQLPGQLSTLEAAVMALQQVEGPSPQLDELLTGFEGFVAQQALKSAAC